jgi:hypothetical protein
MQDHPSKGKRMKPSLGLSGWIGLVVILAGCTGQEPGSPAPAAATPVTQTADTTRGWVGKTAMGFTLPDPNGRLVDVGKVLGTRPVVLVFYRGVW